MISDAHVGRTYPPTEPYLVSREKIAEFADALGDDNPAYRGESPVAPPTFAIVVQDLTLQQLLADPEAEVDFSRVVHGDQRFTYSRPIVAGDELTGTMTVTGVKQLGGNSMVTSATEIVDAAGEHVVTAVSSLVVRAPDEADGAEEDAA